MISPNCFQRIQGDHESRSSIRGLLSFVGLLLHGIFAAKELKESRNFSKLHYQKFPRSQCAIVESVGFAALQAAALETGPRKVIGFKHPREFATFNPQAFDVGQHPLQSK